jgi:hypothetical protein
MFVPPALKNGQITQEAIRQFRETKRIKSDAEKLYKLQDEELKGYIETGIGQEEGDLLLNLKTSERVTVSIEKLFSIYGQRLQIVIFDTKEDVKDFKELTKQHVVFDIAEIFEGGGKTELEVFNDFVKPQIEPTIVKTLEIK